MFIYWDGFEIDGASNVFQINVGPSFYYEYAMYIIDSLRDSFPGLGTCGGLDCAGGWTDGCTYADSMYRYEKIQLPVKHSVRNTLKRLTEADIFRSYRSYYKNGWKYETSPGFYLANHAPLEWGKKPRPVSFSYYLELVETALSANEKPFDIVLVAAAVGRFSWAEGWIFTRATRIARSQYEKMRRTIKNSFV